MIQKYIVAEVSHNKKDYHFHESYLDFDNNISSLNLNDEYIKKDIDNNLHYVTSVLKNMVNAGIYSSMGSLHRAIKNGIITAVLLIIYIDNIEKINNLSGWYTMKDSNSLEKMLELSTATQYVFDMKDSSITRYEIYGDPMLGDDIKRPITDLI